jgi:hypothetical protein
MTVDDMELGFTGLGDVGEDASYGDAEVLFRRPGTQGLID